MEAIPQRFNPMIQLYLGDVPPEGLPPVHIEWLVPSGQFWNNLSPNDREKLRDVMSRLGVDLEEKLFKMRQMLPKDGKTGV